ncbi:hypothetical protein [Streptomyces flavofungini]|uniref:Uncharacterized protein n=1 Tax=Streptomyces flavofungini TaxID=68200 RepID=A0ABS0XF69_9ACTN|nr:hypothetical protein [Streptomyces flavofungini]MBJ3811871.1 hypothetical protein [Streptomyces flavofungini]GHC52794.1 hypothetical protein GCM10010349_18620 [Streptomyces flavofungini]
MAKISMAPEQRRKAVRATTAGLGIVAALAGFIGLARWFDGVWQGDPYPVADPAATSRHLDERSQTVYDALALPHARLDAERSGVRAYTDAYNCDRRGLRTWSDALDPSPPSEPHVVSVSYDWTLRDVPRARAVVALQHARKELTREGWTVAEHRDDRYRLQLSVRPPKDGTSVTLTAYPGDRLEVSAYADCARYPKGTPMDMDGDPELAAMRAPVQLRG